MRHFKTKETNMSIFRCKELISLQKKSNLEVQFLKKNMQSDFFCITPTMKRQI